MCVSPTLTPALAPALVTLTPTPTPPLTLTPTLTLPLYANQASLCRRRHRRALRSERARRGGTAPGLEIGRGDHPAPVEEMITVLCVLFA